MTVNALPLHEPAPPVFILGAGRAGRALARACHAAGVPIVGLHGRSASSHDPDKVTVGAIPATIGDASIVLVTVRDGQMDEALTVLLGAPLADGAVILHASGSSEPVALGPLREAGHPCGTFHPLAPLADAAAGPETMTGAYVGIDGDPGAISAARALADALGSRAVRIPPGRKPLYHAAAVTSANFVTALAVLGARLFRDSGLSPADAEGATRALIRVAAANVERGDFAGALTGPAARGEVETVARHLEALADHPREARIYRELTDAIIHALEQRSVDTPVHAEVLRVVKASEDSGTHGVD